MTRLKTTLMTAAILALPFSAFAQLSTDQVTDEVKDKAVDTVMDNMTTDDALTAGKVMIKGGSKEDAAKAVVKKRVEDKVDGMVGDTAGGMVSKDSLSTDGMMSAGKDMAKKKAMDKVEGAAGSSTTYSDKADHVMKNHDMKDKAASSATTYGQTSMPESGTMAPTPTPTLEQAPLLTTIACPTGTTAQPDGTCMITGDYNQ